MPPSIASAARWISALCLGLSVPMLISGRGLFFVRLHDHVSFAGDDDRADVHFLEIVPTLIWNYRPGWWTLLSSQVIVDWENDGATRQSTGIEIGHVVRRRWGVAMKPELFWGANRAGDWKVTLSVTRYRRK